MKQSDYGKIILPVTIKGQGVCSLIAQWLQTSRLRASELAAVKPPIVVVVK